jgi:UDP-N-acetylglucosamine 2-epimerase (non-hydrolysing)
MTCIESPHVEPAHFDDASCRPRNCGVKDLVFVVGARPNFVKIAPVLHALGEMASDRFRGVLVHTGQHYSELLSDVFFEQLDIPKPDVHLGVGSGSHGAQSARILEAFERYVTGAEPRPAGVVVVGDVNSTMACALAAVKLGIPVAHLEAGLRSFDRSMPEEINRIVTDSISDLLLVSEPHGEENLRHEGVSLDRIVFVGNVMIDTLVAQLPAAQEMRMPFQCGLDGAPYAFVTLHRPSNVDVPERLASIVGFLEAVSRELTVVLPLHPRCRSRLQETGLYSALEKNDCIQLLDALPYLENLSLMQQATVVLTDSGGIQEETSFLGIPCLTLRDNTERPITVTMGTNTIIGHNLDLALSLVRDCLTGHYKTGQSIPGWDGFAAPRVIQALQSRWLLQD